MASDAGRADPDGKLPEVRGWALDEAAVIEVASAGCAAQFFVRCSGSWLRCADLQTAMQAVWEQTHRRAQLPPQWTMPNSETLEAFERQWSRLRDLEAGLWWPPLPQIRLACASGDELDPSA